MADAYNPHFPTIIGEEWVPIRDEDLTFIQVLNNIERGHTFTPLTSQVTTEGRFYLNTYPEELIRNQVWTVNIYPRGEEDQSGPVGRVVIPVNGGSLSGTVGSSGVDFRNCTTVAQALADPSDRQYIRMNLGQATTKAFSVYFAVNQYLELLKDKRILGINLLYSLEVVNLGIVPLDDLGMREEISTEIRNTLAQSFIQYPYLWAGPDSLNPTLWQQGAQSRIQLGDTNVSFPLTNGFNAVTGVPWTLSELQRFESTTANPFETYFRNFGDSGNGPVVSIDYMALEVIYCEERRVGFGCGLYGFGDDATTRNYQMGANPVPLYARVGMGAGVALTAGVEYTVTLSQGNLGDSILFFAANRVGPQPILNATRELYSIPAYEGVEVDVPAPPLPEIVGRVFTAQQSPILPQISLHHSAGTLQSVHAYGRQAVAQVYGNVTARQEVYDAGTTPAPYPQVRYYARRFGDTTVPLLLSPAVSGNLGVALTPAQWDALDPIIDGWKEVTLQFPVAPTLGSGTNPQWVWSASTETAGNRWEVLGAEAPAVSGRSNYMTQAAPKDRLWVNTYGQPVSGGTVNLAWIPQYAPPVSATRDDDSSDAVIMFSQSPAPVSGFAISMQSQALSGIGLGCGLVAPPFIPTSLNYNRLTWNLDQTSQAYDVFDRTVASGWGTATNGAAWTVFGTASAFNVTPGRATVDLTTTYRRAHLGGFSRANVDAYVEISSNTLASVTDHWGSLFLRSDGVGNNEIYGEINWAANGDITLILRTVVGGVHTLLGQKVFGKNYTVNDRIALRMQLIGTGLKAKAWLVAEAEPVDWTLFVDTTTNPQAGGVGTRNITGGGGPAVTLSYYNLLVSDTALGYTELQRSDLLTDWQTIMKATDQSLTVFNDYEARTTLASDYRIRKVNALGFAGAWSSTVSNTIPAPGVTALDLTANDHVWIFTTNSIQSGASNLAYALGWEGEVSEDFNFPEGAAQTFQTMYGKDYVTVFRPFERGGTNFTRTILVQAAAIPPETLEDFTSLRDMAWTDVPYICLRDEDGNRWFSNVTVPGGTVLHFRKLYLAPVSIVEVTDTPTPVDP